MAEHADALAAKTAEAADDRGVLAVLAIAGQRYEIGDQGGYIVAAVGPLRMPRDLRLLPRREAAVEFFQCLSSLDFEAVDLLDDADRLAVGLQRAQFLDLGIEFGHRFFKVEIAAHTSLFRMAA